MRSTCVHLNEIEAQTTPANGRLLRCPSTPGWWSNRWKKRPTSPAGAGAGEHGHSDGIHLASLRWQEVGAYFTVTAFVFVAGFTKIGFHHLHWLSNTVPESCVLVILGAALGLLVFFTEDDPAAGACDFNIPLPHFTSDMFFFILLPPIVLESAYSLHDRSFFDNLGTVLVYAVVGTMFNIFAIGPTLYGLAGVGAMGNITLSMRESLVFSSLISAVDPVAVLVIFQELGVNKDLYFLVFGESLLNDGVTVVLYNTMNTFLSMESVPAAQYALAIVAFFIVVFGGIAIGIVYGCLTAFITKSTTDVRVVEPLALFCLAYLCYLTAELFHFSGIISLIVCGLVQAHYAFQNISQKSYACVKYFTKMASATSDTIIFMFLGMVLVSDDHVWHTGFVLWTVSLCLVFRFIGVFLLTGIMNHYRIKKINIEEQFIAAYGGLRGAVAFSLVQMLDDHLERKAIFVTTTLVVILFTIFIQGVTIKPLVNFLQIQRKSSDRKNLNEEINDTAMDHIMAGIEEVLGQHGDFYLRALMIYYNDKYLKKWMVRPSCETKLQRLFEKIAISEHYAHLYGPVAMIEDHVKPLCKTEVARTKLARSNSLSPSMKEQVMMEASIMDDDDTGLVQDGVQLRKKRTGSLSIFTGVTAPVGWGPSTGASAARLPHHPHQLEEEAGVGAEGGDRDSSGTSEALKRSREARQTLRKAFRDNPYNKLHYKYNRNLVDEEDQELSEHLQRRHLNARRMTSFASGSQSSGSFIVTSSRPKTEFYSSEGSREGTGGGGGGGGGSAGAGGGGRRALYDGVAELRERHQRRRHTMALRRRTSRPPLQSCFSSPESSSSVGSSAPLPPPVTLNTLRETSPQDSDVFLTDVTTSPKDVRSMSRMAAIGGLGSSAEREEEEEEEEELALISSRTEDLEETTETQEGEKKV
ncbi:LOW QUALITY PROTEIN: Na(+)/H(+) exchanger beta-like [Macrobrachium nipponense]|uniref:LOW QUALITY PROTEIN: Na(+)/H(+) exchanger beta-like n=1 Tax=Macrobrachium nipponense TaxID=159736 RepID=UPI0030C8BC3F